MNEKVKSVSLEHFRGLPATEFDFSGKNTVIFGSNGKGKSGLVDGIEFLFSGQVGRFNGVGTQGINHDDAVNHVARGGTPKVSVSLLPSTASFSRTLGGELPQFCAKPQGLEYHGAHPGVNSFILRRAQILEFISNQPSDRYKKFVQLLGISGIDSLQAAFITAEKESAASLNNAGLAYSACLAAFNEPARAFAPKNLEEIIVNASSLVEDAGGEKLSHLDSAFRIVETLKAKRPAANKEKLDALSKAIAALELVLPHNLDEDATDFASKSKRLDEISQGIADAAKANIIEGGLTFFNGHRDEVQCPLCEQTLLGTAEDLIARLDLRSLALRELKEAQQARNAVLEKLKAALTRIISTVERDLIHAELLLPEQVDFLTSAKADAETLNDILKNFQALVTLTIHGNLGELAGVRAASLTHLNDKKAELVAPDSSKLEAAIGYLERVTAASSGITQALAKLVHATEIARRAKFANAAFKKSRETAIETVFTGISATVLAFYRKLHDCEEVGENSECTDLSLTPDSRAAGGGLKLVIQFLQVADPKDPRAFLSEGHLDSLGLCIFLATVKIFNPPGTLLVLDDVLTSIDKDHRHRVCELLLDDFSGYQIILTTHDEQWFDLLKSVTRARGLQAGWGFTKVEAWCVERGPTFSVRNDSWSYIDTHLTEADYRELGGPFRLVLEDFLKRAAVKLESKVKFKYDGKYTSGDFTAAGIQDDVRRKLIAAVSAAQNPVVSDAEIITAVGRVFGTGDLINFLSHDNPGRLEVTFPQARDFVTGLKLLIRECTRYSLMRG